MKFSLQMLFALNGAAAMQFFFLRSPPVGFILLFVVIPFALIGLGLTSPRRDHQLDPSGRWYFMLLAKTWVLSVFGLGLMKMAALFIPSFSKKVSIWSHHHPWW